MSLPRSRTALLAAALGSVLLCVGSAVPAGAADAPQLGLRFYSGPDRTGTEWVLDHSEPGVCYELPAAARSFSAIATPSPTDVYFTSDCRTGTPDAPGDWHYVVGTLNQGNFPLPALSYRVRAEA